MKVMISVTREGVVLDMAEVEIEDGHRELVVKSLVPGTTYEVPVVSLKPFSENWDEATQVGSECTLG